MDLEIPVILKKFVRQTEAVTTDSAFCVLKVDCVDWIHLVQDRGQWLAVNMVMNGNEPLNSIICWLFIM
jgi:hypothetical protein